MTLDDLVRLLNQDPRPPILHIPSGAVRVTGALRPGLPGPLVDLLLRDNVADASRAIRAFGLRLTSLRTIWAQDSWNHIPAILERSA